MDMRKYVLNNYLKRCTMAMGLGVFAVHGNAQALIRQSIGSFGVSAVSGGIWVQQTVGQPYSTKTFYSSSVGYKPGFQQSSLANTLPVAQPTDLRLNVYPNPAVSTVTVESPEAVKSALIMVRSLDGKLVLEKKMDAFTSYSFDCGDWANGIYIFSLLDSKGHQYLSKLIISK